MTSRSKPKPEIEDKESMESVSWQDQSSSRAEHRYCVSCLSASSRSLTLRKHYSQSAIVNWNSSLLIRELTSIAVQRTLHVTSERERHINI